MTNAGGFVCFFVGPLDSACGRRSGSFDSLQKIGAEAPTGPKPCAGLPAGRRASSAGSAQTRVEWCRGEDLNLHGVAPASS